MVDAEIVRAELWSGGVRLCRSAWPRPTQGSWILVEPRIVGLCSSDLKEVRRRREIRSDFGHEMVGLVHSSTVPELPPGARVCLDPHVEVERTTAFGNAMLLSAEPEQLRTALPAAPATAPDERAVFVEPLACVAHCATHVTTGADVAIVGAGTAGVLLAVLLRLRGCHVTLVNRGAGRLRNLASMRLLDGIRLVGASDAEAGAFGTVVVATTLLDDATFEGAWRLLPERDGRLVLFGGIRADWRVPGSDLLLDSVRRKEDEIELERGGRRVLAVGSHGPTSADVAVAIAVLDAPLPWSPTHVEELIVERIDLPGLVALLSEAARTGVDPVGKCVVDMRAQAAAHSAA